jgi:hypothetical protein
MRPGEFHGSRCCIDRDHSCYVDQADVLTLPSLFKKKAVRAGGEALVLMARTIAMLGILASSAAPALAACPMELSVYGERDGVAEINFTPTLNRAVVTNTFRMLLEDDLALDGIVMWTEAVPRPSGMLMYKCPQGDVTGAELAVCTVWQGVIYTSDDKGNIELLPAEGAEAPAKLIFPDLARSLQRSAAFDADELSKVPWDVFALKGCQE